MKKSLFYTIIICISLNSCSENSSLNNKKNTIVQKKQFIFEFNDNNKRNEYSLSYDQEKFLKDQFIYVDRCNILHSNNNCKLLNEKKYIKKIRKDSIKWNISNSNKLCKNCLSYKQYIWMSNYWITPKINFEYYSYNYKMIEFKMPQIYKFSKEGSNVNLKFNKINRNLKNDSTKRIIIFKNEFDSLNYIGIHITEDKNVFSNILLNSHEWENNEKCEQYYEAVHYREFLDNHYKPLMQPVIFSKKHNNNIFYVGFTLFEFNPKEYYCMKTYTFNNFYETITIFSLYNIVDIKQEFYFDKFLNSIILGKNGPSTDAVLI